MIILIHSPNHYVSAEGKEFITSTFQLCEPIRHPSDLVNFKAWLTNAWTDLGMANYPYPANFLEPLPAWPVKVCQLYCALSIQ